MTAKELYLYAVDQATAVVVQLEPEQFELATPDTDWNVRNLLRHMLYELAWTTDIVAGKTVAEVGATYDGDLLGQDAIASWRAYALLAQEAVERCGEDATAHLSYGDKTIGEYLWEAGNDQLVHAWDLGQAIGVSVVFYESAAQALYRRVQAQGEEPSETGLFAGPVTVPATANTQTKLLAALGRSENWPELKTH